MRKQDVVVGKTYLMKRTGGNAPVKILSQVVRHGYSPNTRDCTHWIGLNLNTNREVEIKSAVKLIKEVITA